MYKYCITRPTQLEKLNYIYGKRRKHFDREALEKGLSLYEITLILHSDKVTIEQMSPEWKEQNSYDYDHYVWSLIKNTKMSIFRFNRWPGKDRGVNILPLKFKTEIGTVWLYCNIQNDKDWNQYELILARHSLGIQKSKNELSDIVEMSPKERAEKNRKLEEEINAKQEANRKQYMKEAKTWDGKPMYSEIDITGINLKKIA